MLISEVIRGLEDLKALREMLEHQLLDTALCGVE